MSWGALDPNSDHQVWSRWTFKVRGRRAPFAEVELNALRWLRLMFGSVGQGRVEESANGLIEIVAEVEGVPAHDPGYVAHVRRKFRAFVVAGWGVAAVDSVSVKVLAGDVQDGRPRSQLVVMPSIK